MKSHHWFFIGLVAVLIVLWMHHTGKLSLGSGGGSGAQGLG